MNIQNEYNGIKFGDKCRVWNYYKSESRERIFVAYNPDADYPFLTSGGFSSRHIEPLPKKEAINRLEIIGPQGREHVLFGYREYEHDIQLQDDGKTLKIFLTEVGK
jgi:hypothetical protein